MPHPERAAEAILGSDDGLGIIRSLVESARDGAAAAWPRAVGGAPVEPSARRRRPPPSRCIAARA